MALLLTLIDKNVGASAAQQTLTPFTTTTYNHSLNTTPDLTLVNVVSVPSNTTIAYPFAVGANASLATVQMPSSLGAAAAAFQVWNVYFHSVVR
jgi:hypothetical protein